MAFMNASERSQHGPTHESFGAPHRFTPERTHILAISLMGLVCIIMAGWSPLLLGWTVLLPIAALYWVLRASTTVDEQGLQVTYAFRGSRHITWADLQGIAFQGARAFARTGDAQRHVLPGVTFNSLPTLHSASKGRIPDALTSGQKAADDKVVIIHRDGQQVLLSKEEFAAQQHQTSKH